MKPIRFKFAPAKALAALHWIISEQPGIDLHPILKACYFADKSHLNAFGRPIFGATYKAMKFGPVPLEIYVMLKSEPLWLAELGIEQVPWQLDGYHLRLTGNQEPDIGALSESNMEHLGAALRASRTMTFQ
ncbi:Panacea domain-containing protein [Mesorhizobium sp. L-8-3]|uniref:Panacea domain-containing protein n=1 Tax=Mesorhizobium sp. L-8-3 TaxID=2744522 RepID=UPI0019257666|nr:Panacea domain-containing protein [Mesorhizobium sp. L-8-3]BCH27544.1 hypothetical protein MesoLjLb_73290 [Mesorhizobium sp. L-8-3]